MKAALTGSLNWSSASKTPMGSESKVSLSSVITKQPNKTDRLCQKATEQYLRHKIEFDYVQHLTVLGIKDL